MTATAADDGADDDRQQPDQEAGDREEHERCRRAGPVPRRPRAATIAPVVAPPSMIDGMTRSGSAAANGIAPSVMNDEPEQPRGLAVAPARQG